jgi:hypothetical protein
VRLGRAHVRRDLLGIVEQRGRLGEQLVDVGPAAGEPRRQPVEHLRKARRLLASKVFITSSSSTVGCAALSGRVVPASMPSSEAPGFSSRYLSPSVERGLTVHH